MSRDGGASTMSSLENERNKVQVLTAGGAASLSTKKRTGKRTTAETSTAQNNVAEAELLHLEYEETEHEEDVLEPPAHTNAYKDVPDASSALGFASSTGLPRPGRHLSLESASQSGKKTSELVWLGICFFGIMASFVAYGLLLEYTTSGGRKLHELSFLFVTSGLYTLTAAAGRYVRDETPTTIPPARFAVLGLTSMGSTFCSVRSLR